MHTDITTTIVASSKKEYREKLIQLFLKEAPGSSEEVTEYFYFVDTDNAGHRIYLKRPTALNKGVDFEVRVEGVQFRYGKYNNEISTGNRPSHEDIYNDLASKKAEDATKFALLKPLFEKIHNCEEVTDAEYAQFSFSNGISVKLLMKCLKWLFIEQDITYWNRSGREMLYNGIGELWD
jgi:hypothetical protein